MKLELIYEISKDFEQLKRKCFDLELLLTKGQNLPEIKHDTAPPVLPLFTELEKNLQSLSLSKLTIDEILEIKNEFYSINSELREKYGESIDIASKEEEEEYKKKANNLNTKMMNRIPVWQDRFLVELRSIKVNELYTKTLINPEKLERGTEAFFAEEVLKQMDDLTKEDFSDGCSCILIKTWTPAAMIIMRSIESGLRTLYSKITKNDPSGKNWGTLIAELKKDPNIDKRLLDYFDYLREFRNRLQHPDARFIQSETEDVLTQSIHIFNRIFI